MILSEIIVREDGVPFMHTYSDERRYIRKVSTTEVYEDAIDIYPSAYEYEETEEYIPVEEKIQTNATVIL